MKQLKLVIVFVFFCTVNTNLFSQSNNHIEFTLSTPYFTNGVDDQAVYIQFPEESIWGWIEVTISSSGNYELSTGKLTKRYQIAHNPKDEEFFHLNTEIQEAFGHVANQWVIGDFDHANNRIPIYHLVNTANALIVKIEGVINGNEKAENVRKNTSISALVSLPYSGERHYKSIMQDRVGVGTNQPFGKFHVLGSPSTFSLGAGTSNLNSLVQVLNGDDHVFSNGKALLHIKNQGDNGAIRSANGSDLLRLDFSDATAMIVNKNGQVGIGTANPEGHKLFVNGSVGAKSYKLKVDSIPSFDFNTEKELRSINEVDSLINANHYLPDVPTEEEMVENGIDLLEMNILLLHKIEELTLYMIEQNKRIEQLEQENQALQEEGIEEPIEEHNKE